LYLIIK